MTTVHCEFCNVDVLVKNLVKHNESKNHKKKKDVCVDCKKNNFTYSVVGADNLKRCFWCDDNAKKEIKIVNLSNDNRKMAEMLLKLEANFENMEKEFDDFRCNCKMDSPRSFC
jgi:hypothetical protein